MQVHPRDLPLLYPNDCIACPGTPPPGTPMVDTLNNRDGALGIERIYICQLCVQAAMNALIDGLDFEKDDE